MPENNTFPSQDGFDKDRDDRHSGEYGDRGGGWGGGDRRGGGGGGGGAGGRSREASPFRRRGRRKVCRFCAEKTLPIDYKEVRILSNFVTERGRIIHEPDHRDLRAPPAPADHGHQAGPHGRAHAVHPRPQVGPPWKSSCAKTCPTSG
jgi:small subunit ribosomal protein S18